MILSDFNVFAADLIEIVLSLMGLVVIFLSSIRFFISYIYNFFTNQDLNFIRLNLGNNIILGLDFIIGADIAHSMVELTYSAIGKLMILVILRIILSYFLIKELEHISKY